MLMNMDNNTIKSMMSSMGQNLSDDQINLLKNESLMKNCFSQMKSNPDMLKNIDQLNLNKNNSNTNGGNSTNNTSVMNQSNQSNQSNPFNGLNMNDFPKNMDYSSMVNFISKNPDLIKSLSPQLSQMLGGNNGNGNANIPNLDTLIYLFTLPHRIKTFFLSTKGILLVGSIVCLAAYYFFG